MIARIYYSGLYQMLTPVIVLLALIFAVISLVIALKFKKYFLLAITCISLFIAYQGIPYYFTAKAFLAKDEAGVVNNFNFAIKTAMFPTQKGLLHSSLASYYAASKKGPDSLKHYEIAHKYLKTYKINYWPTFYPAIAEYLAKGDVEKAIEISNETGLYSYAVKANIIKGDFTKALEASEKVTRQSAWTYADRAVVYKNMGRENDALQSYNKALALCKTDKCRQYVNGAYKNYKTFHKEWYDLEKKNLNF